ncbi:hypothetical protein [Streptomyces violascens]|uniref:Uncharacterized protein n=1 Tax=Streptomyces violascens TaxID=67381 RepID=A0ABQ3QUY4_9ACTN|nr:hypothetical protein [Streptomyces violascens]GHI41096.1 hypothetical protein Sviol_55040 [Streptomyces violascens]
MTHSARAAEPPTPHTSGIPAREQSPPRPTFPSITTEGAFAEIARLANLLCEHLADHQWQTADHIRRLAETHRTTPGAS